MMSKYRGVILRGFKINHCTYLTMVSLITIVTSSSVFHYTCKLVTKRALLGCGPERVFCNAKFD